MPLDDSSGRRAPANLPEGPGVYLFRGSRDRILYVGKARSLRRRVSSYFNRTPEDPKARALLEEFASVETISTKTELEALLLENTLIKKHHPRYNILLRDDKTYPYIKVTTGEQWPRAFITRRVKADGHSYYGPFWGGLARRTMQVITRLFQIRTCRIEIDGKLPRPCLYYDMHACLGPCVAGLTTSALYDDAVRDVLLFLEGKNAELVGRLRQKMDRASSALQYELAAVYRDALKTVEEVAERQVVQRLSGEDVDVWGLYESEGDVAIQVLIVRGGAVVDRREFFFEGAANVEPAEALASLLPQFYDVNTFIPEEVHLPAAVAGAGLIEEFLSAKRGGRVRLRVPQRGPSRDRLEIAAANARSRHAVRFRRVQTPEQDAVTRLARMLGLAETPTRIEAIDISHLQGTDSYASLVVFEDGQPRKSEYKLFKVRQQSLLSPDDFASMAEAVRRRYGRLQQEKGRLPDLLIVDGGKGQMSSALTSLDRLGIEIAVAGIAKKEEELFVPGLSDPIRLARSDAALQLVQRIRDEAHRFAIKRHRGTRSRRLLRSRLTEIPGVGPERARRLLRRFGSIDGVRRASHAELAHELGPRLAEIVEQHLAGAA
jgi:excinuclease ABC subunit C